MSGCAGDCRTSLYEYVVVLIEQIRVLVKIYPRLESS
jgi:hypothetical protein